MVAQPLSEDAFRPYGWLLGKAGAASSFHNADTDFWEEHIFETDAECEAQVLRVNYRNRRREVDSLEMHRFTQQVVIPVSGELVQVVATSQADGTPDVASLRAFRVRVGEGICMRAGCWHSTRVDDGEVRCFMLTRRSTTVDLIGYLKTGSALRESAIAEIPTALIAF